MEELKQFITTLVTMIILMSAIELIAPDNSMKKYLKFVLGLIFISVMLSPIIYIFTKGEENISVQIQGYIDLDESQTMEVMNKNDNSKDIFKGNLEENCNRILKGKFEGMEFISEIDCDVDMENIEYSINKISIGVGDKGISKIQKVTIGTKDSNINTSENSVNNEDEIINYLSEILKVPKDKIEVYKLS